MNDTITEMSLVTSASLVAAYAALSNDDNPLHLDAGFAATTAFGKPVAHGALGLDLLLIAIDAAFGQRQGAQLDVRFTAPVVVGERITAGGEKRDDVYDVWVRKDDGAAVIMGTLRLGGAV